MTDDVAQAVRYLQELCLRRGRDNYQLNQRCEEALDDLLRSPGRVGPVRWLVRDATRNATKKLRARATTAAIEPHGDLYLIDAGVPAPFEPAAAPAWLEALAPADRELVALDALGFSPRELAALKNTRPDILYPKLSRARAPARAAYLAAA